VRMPFGKHKGLDLADVPADYLRWVRPKVQRPDLRSAVDAELARRAARRHYERHSPPRMPHDSLAGDVRRLALEIVTRGYRAAAREHHPDMGGDVEEMQRVNAAADALRELLGGAA
jgi:hypothetical protein